MTEKTTRKCGSNSPTTSLTEGLLAKPRKHNLARLIFTLLEQLIHHVGKLAGKHAKWSTCTYYLYRRPTYTVD